MWDNTQDKRNSKSPDYKCKDKVNCDGAIWLQPKASVVKAATAGPVNRPQAAMPGSTTAPAFSIEAYIRVFRTVGRYFEALSQKEAWMESFTVADVQAATATIIIQYAKLGIPLPERKSKAPIVPTPIVRQAAYGADPDAPIVLDSIEQQFDDEDASLPF